MTDILITDFIIGIFIYLRIAAALIASPVFGNQGIPVTVKLALALVVAYITFLTINKDGIVIEFSIWFLVINAFKEIISGLIIGFMIHFIFYGVSFAGTIIGFDMGLAMATMFNPAEEIQNNVVGEFLYIAAILVFFLINGHHYIIRGLVYSYSVIPIGKFTINGSVFHLLIKYSASVFIIAVKIASPILVSFFLIHIGEGILAKVIPQLQVFFITQPLKIIVGFFLLTSLVPIYIYVLKNLLKGYEDNLFNLVKAMGT